MYLGIVPALTVLAISISPEAPRMQSLPELSRLSGLESMVSISVPRASLVTYDMGAGLIKIPRGQLSLEQLSRIIASPQVGFVVWSEQDDLYIGLSSVHTRAYLWRSNKLVIGTPRQFDALEKPRLEWLGPLACIEEVPDFKVRPLRKLWVEACGAQWREPSEFEDDPRLADLDLLILGMRDHEMRGWAELLKFARGDGDALDVSFMERFDELSTSYRRHTTLHRALSYANDDALVHALETLDRARILGRRFDVDQGVATGQRIDSLGHAWLMRVLVGLFQRGEEREALGFYDNYRHWTAQQPLWLKRRVAQAMRRSGRARESLELYHEVLHGVEPAHTLLGEIGTTYIEDDDAFRARGVQLWLEHARELETQPDFTILLRRAEARGVCPPDTSWTAPCIEARKAENGEHLDVLLAEKERVVWGKIVPTQGRVELSLFDEKAP